MSTIISDEGKIRCLITGAMRKETPEEYVRQDFCRKLLDVYKYPKEHIAVEFPISIGRSTKRVDIAVFHSDQHTQSNIYIVVETKNQNEVEGIEQLISYVSATTAQFGVWTNELGITYIQKEPGTNKCPEVTDIPKFGQSIDAIGKYKKGDLVPCPDLKGIFEKCNNYFYVNQGLTNDKRFTEIIKLLFMKIEDEKDVLSEECSFYVTPKEKASDVGMCSVRGRIEALFTKVKERFKRDDIFELHDSVKLNDRCLGFAIAELQKYSLLSTDLDIKGIAFETFVGANLRGEHGEFFTPREVVKMAVQMVAPQPNEIVLDPACGSGGFLVATLDYIRELFKMLKAKSKMVDTSVFNRDYAERCILGIDFNPDLARVSKMNMVLNDDGHTGIFHHDSLLPFNQWEPHVIERINPNTIDIILTNPPFGDKCKIDDKRILRSFDLGHKWVQDTATGIWCSD